MKSKHRSSESESSSDDENLAHLREAADHTLISDSMFQLAGKRPEEISSSKPMVALKSQRHIADDNERIDDLLIPEEVQKFVSKKLAKIIENRVEFVDIRGSDEAEHRTDNTVQQISLLDNVVLSIDWADGETTKYNERKKQDIKKRKIPDVDDSKADSVRIREAVIHLEDVSKEINNWKTRPKGTVFEYHEKNGKLYEVEPTTEFSAMRKRNNWNECKISRNTNRSE